MSDPTPFQDLVRRVRGGDEQAATELVRRYEPLIRREVRLRLEDQRLGRVFESMDVCQSVLASFFVRTAAGQFDLDEPGQLLALLVRMARNKVVSAARHQRRQRRDDRRQDANGVAGLEQAAAHGESPSQVVAGQELLARFFQGLSEEERQIADLRVEGLAWADVAGRLGGTAQARRMQLARAVGRISRELGLEEPAQEGRREPR